MTRKSEKLLLLFIVLLLCTNCTEKKEEAASSPRIVNIVNFIRQTEPRSEEITDSVLYETVHEQIKLMTKYNLPGTFLLQYDALINPRYQELLKEELKRGSEVGAWWEITQPHVEEAGLTWRGRYPWDWHADVGFATGYTPEEREKLIDVYMEKFKTIFGKYPASVGSWFIDAHSLAYMYDKYGITASCNCKDQMGTDGYTLWGGYWNQAYYPSRKNAYMPAQNAEAQIPVPVFRMLGSDPIYQYDTGVGSDIQGVITLEPVYGSAGSSRPWVERFFKSIFDDPSLGFNYTQAGQENSFTWEKMKEGLEMQFPIIAQFREQNKIRVETLEQSGKWFKEKYAVTPPTSVTALTDTYDEGRKTAWFNSRYYRANLLWDKNTIRFRDIHLFDEKLESDYLTKRGTSNQCVYTTLPVVDGFIWSKPNDLAGLRFYQLDKSGNKAEIALDNMLVNVLADNEMEVSCKAKSGETYTILFDEKGMEINSDGKEDSWLMELHVAEGAELPFTSVTKDKLYASSGDFKYEVACKEGEFKQEGSCFQLIPAANKIILDCTNNR